MNAESEQSRFDPDEIVRNSGILWQRAKDNGHAISQKVAIATQIGAIGRDMVKETLSGTGRGSVAPDINFVLRGLDNKAATKFEFGIGGILLASILNSLEDGIINGWEDQIFVDNYNSRIIGTPMPPIKIENLLKKPRIDGNLITFQEETNFIRKEIKRNPSFLGFFDPGLEETLPRVISALLDGQPSLKRGLYMVLPYYQEAISKLK